MKSRFSHEVRFSNSYAIDYHLLGFDDWYFNYDDAFSDNPDFMELDYLINSADEKELLSFIQCNPEVVAEYLKELNRAFWLHCEKAYKQQIDHKILYPW